MVLLSFHLLIFFGCASSKKQIAELQAQRKAERYQSEINLSNANARSLEERLSTEISTKIQYKEIIESKIKENVILQDAYDTHVQKLHEDMTAQKRHYEKAMQLLEAKVEIMSNKLQQPDIISKLELLAKLEEKEKSSQAMEVHYGSLISEKIEQIKKTEQKFNRIIDEVEKKAYSNGQLTVWQSLSISGQPYTREEGWFKKASFLEIKISVGDHVFFRQSVKTEETEVGFGTTFAAVTSAASVIPYLTILR